MCSILFFTLLLDAVYKTGTRLFFVDFINELVLAMLGISKALNVVASGLQLQLFLFCLLN
jgi:hypothetical protein